MSRLKTIFLKNTLYASTAHTLSLLVSVSLSMLLPRFISMEDYGYWQLFILYSSYIGALHFGYCDGIYLKYGGANFDSIDKKLLAPQFRAYVLLQLLFSFILIVCGVVFSNSHEKTLIFILLGIYSFIANISTLMAFVLTATNRILQYSLSVVYSKLLLFVFLLAIIFLPVQFSYWTIIAAYVLTFIVGLVYLFPLFKEFFIGSYSIHIRHLKTIYPFVASGFVLMFSNIIGNFVMGSGRMIVEYFWNIEAFAKLSFAISISMFLLAFISQVSMILFPLLRNMNKESTVFVLKGGSFLIGYGMMICYIFFIPICFFVNYWIPSYVDSLVYVIYLLPVSLFLIKTQVIYITFFKNLNKQKILMLINVLTLILALILYGFAASNHSLEGVVISMLIACCFRSWAMMIYLNRFYKCVFDNINLLEILFTIGFIFCYKFFGLNILLVYYGVSILIITFLYRQYLLYLLRQFVKK